MINKISAFFNSKTVLILGFGKEGQSTYHFFKKFHPSACIAIADQDPYALDRIQFPVEKEIKFYSGPHYLNAIRNYDMVIKTPGIPRETVLAKAGQAEVTSQTNLFLRFFRDRIIGVTGTKGKSTTSSLIRHILFKHDGCSFLVGNIGLPPFDYVSQLSEDSHIVFELSSHQLHDVMYSPHIAIFLNLFEEHLDHYGTLENYRQAKNNIFRFQKDGDFLIFNGDNSYLHNIKMLDVKGTRVEYALHNRPGVSMYANELGDVYLKEATELISFRVSARKALPGKHNLLNIMSAVKACRLLGIPVDTITSGVNEFKGLEHRLEFVGIFKGIRFYNDSIATVPEATIEAIHTLPDTDTIILGGKDRGINYNLLIEFLPKTAIRNFICMGDAGKRIYDGVRKNLSDNQKAFMISDFSSLSEIISQQTEPGKICLLSPAASSYDWFHNFEERGKAFKKIAENL